MPKSGYGQRGVANAVPSIRLQPMTEAEFAAYSAEKVPEFAHDVERADGRSEAAALEQARSTMVRILPQGPATPGHSMSWIVDDASGERVGNLWLFLDPAAPRVFVYDIEVRPEHRRRGYAEAALAQAWAIGRSAGATRLELHVFGHNAGAIALYEKLGFTTTHRQMSKPL